MFLGHAGPKPAKMSRNFSASFGKGTADSLSEMLIAGGCKTTIRPAVHCCGAHTLRRQMFL